MKRSVRISAAVLSEDATAERQHRRQRIGCPAVLAEFEMQIGVGGLAACTYIADDVPGLGLASDALRQSATLLIRLNWFLAALMGYADNIAIATTVTLKYDFAVK
jgi:hypothetical protein